MSNQNRCCVILNPHAGSGFAGKQWPSIKYVLDAAGLDTFCLVTGATGDARRLAREGYDQGANIVVAVGGDGTAHEIINGLMDLAHAGLSPPRLGIIGVGRGNDFAHALGIPVEIEDAVQVLTRGQERRIDIGHVVVDNHQPGEYFGNCVGIGFDAIGTIEAAKLPRWGGFLSFLFAVLKTIFLYHRGPMITMTCDGSEYQDRVLMLSIMNGRRLGGGFWMAPQSRPDDGVFDLCIVQQVTRQRILTLIPHFFKGSQSSQPEVTALQAKHISVVAREGVLPAQSDGEIISTSGTELTIELIPHALRVIAPGGVNA